MCQLGDSVEYEHRCTQTDPSVGELNGTTGRNRLPTRQFEHRSPKVGGGAGLCFAGNTEQSGGAEIRETDLHGAQGGRGTVESDSAAERSGNIVRPGIREDVAERRDTIDHVDRISDRRARVRELDGATGRLRFNRCLQIYGTAGPGGRRDGHRCRRSHIGGRHLDALRRRNRSCGCRITGIERSDRVRSSRREGMGDDSYTVVDGNRIAERHSRVGELNGATRWCGIDRRAQLDRVPSRCRFRHGDYRRGAGDSVIDRDRLR